MQVSPRILEFHAPFTKQQTQEVTVSNETSSYLAFKVKTTAPKLYCVRPNASTVAPGESTKVNIILQGLPEEPAIGTKCKDKFLFVSVPCDGEIDPKSVSGKWSELQTVAGGSSKGVKMKVSFNFENAINPIIEEEKGPAESAQSASANAVGATEAAVAASSAAGVVSTGVSGATKDSTVSRSANTSTSKQEQVNINGSEKVNGKRNSAASAPPVVEAKSSSSINPYVAAFLIILLAYFIFRYCL
ncbi:DEKNAAC105049 [Brettanomyces naardenensis]|uniref:DEKNAAC105050 n=1 Tax=Brettanomyces naardenensis TaxID=13370 RepID=A0A448YS16_BRENA|nr:DEKNAAC105049 [Brettanomyces naardenensis]